MIRRSFITTLLVALGLRKAPKYNPILPLGSPLSADDGLRKYRLKGIRYLRISVGNPPTHTPIWN